MSPPEDAATPGHIDWAPWLALEFYRDRQGRFGYFPVDYRFRHVHDRAHMNSRNQAAWSEVECLIQASRPLSECTVGDPDSDPYSYTRWVYAIDNAPAWTALARVFETYLTSWTGRKIVLYGEDHKQVLEITGHHTAEQIEALLRAWVAPPGTLVNREAPSDPARNVDSYTGPDAKGGTVLELEFGQIRSNRMHFGPRDTPGCETWVEVKPLLQESPLLSYRTSGGGNAHDGWWVYAIASAPAWAALASVLKAYITRRIGRKVILYGDDGTKLLEITGDLTAEQIEALLSARVAPPELGRTTSDTGESRPPPDGPTS